MESTAFDPAGAQQSRQQQCELSTVMRIGTPGMESVTAGGLDGTADQLATAANPDY